MAQRAEREMMMNKQGGVRTKVAGDDEMLRTGFHNGTALEAGKIADSNPVDLFATAHRLDDAPSEDHHHQHQQQQMRPQQQQEDEDEAAAGGHGKNSTSSRVIAESEPVDLPASARGVAQANNDDGDNPAAPAPAPQGMAAHAAGGRRLGRQA